jgi:hypothetical protein
MSLQEAHYIAQEAAPTSVESKVGRCRGVGFRDIVGIVDLGKSEQEKRAELPRGEEQ